MFSDCDQQASEESATRATPRAMLSTTVLALACLCLARSSPAETYGLRLYPNPPNTKDLTGILSSIDERLRMLEVVNANQVKQARRLDVIQDKLDRLETTFNLKLERAQLAAERLEHRLHILQVNVQTTIKDTATRIEKSHTKITDLVQNLTKHMDNHIYQLEKINGVYSNTFRRGLVLETLMRDGLALVNVTRRELADGLRALARRQRDSRSNSVDLDTIVHKRINENTNKLFSKIQELSESQKKIVDSCQRVQQDDPNHVATALDKLFDSLIDKIGSIFRELKTIQTTVREHDSNVMKFINLRTSQADVTCRRLESAFRNSSHGNAVFRENELKQLTEKFVDLTDRADAALQRLEAQMGDDMEDESFPTSEEVKSEADKLLLKLKGIKNENSEHDVEWEDIETGYFEDGGGGDLMEEDKKILNKRSMEFASEEVTYRPPHRRHLHKHPYDRGPKWMSRP